MSQNEPNIEAKKALESQISQIMLSSYYSGRSEGIDIGAMSERERIIELLEPRLAAMGSDHCMCHTISAAVIRLIKEENK
jgi:hypothetical protein